MGISNKRKIWITVTCFLPVVFIVFIFLFIIPQFEEIFEDFGLDFTKPPSIHNMHNLYFQRVIFVISHHWMLLALILIVGGMLISRCCIVSESCLERKQRTVLIRFVWGAILVGFAILSVATMLVVRFP